MVLLCGRPLWMAPSVMKARVRIDGGLGVPVHFSQFEPCMKVIISVVHGMCAFNLF